MRLSQGLAADIGGTNTRLALVENGRVCKETIVRYRNADFKTPEDAIDAYLSGAGNPACGAAVIAIAAPIEGKSIRMTNHPWVFDTSCLQKVLGSAKVHFLNDFEALAHSLDRVDPTCLRPVLLPETRILGRSTRLVVGAGTGFNAAALFPTTGESLVKTGECGHSTLPVENEREMRLWKYLSRNRGRASVERALSGNGLREVYEWLCQESDVIAEPLLPADIARRAKDGDDQICVATARQWVALLGRVVGDLSLVFLARGGVVLSGGVTRALSQFLDEPEFRNAFRSKGRQTDLVSDIPIHLLDDDFAALSGCAAHM